MAYVIAVCGSGGKTTLVKSLAKKYANENKKVCITTTTHMWYDEDAKKSLIVGTDASNVATNANNVGAMHCEPEHISLGNFLNNNEFASGRVYYIANVNKEKELIIPLNEFDYKLVCEKFDYVIIEADGSRSMPMKIPRKGEPVIPVNANEIIIVVGMESMGREIGAVCHRFNEFYENDKYLSDNRITPETIVTERLLDDFVKHYYYEPLKQKFCNAKISIYKNDFARGSQSSPIREDSQSSPIREDSHSSPVRVAIVLCASGFSKRFGENKLLLDMDVDKQVGRDGLNEQAPAHAKLYQIMIDKLLNAREILINKFNNDCEVNKKSDLQKNNSFEKKSLSNENYLNVDVIVVTQYDEILNDKNYNDKVIMLKNNNASEGLSKSIKLAVEFCDVAVDKYDAIVFVNADMPYLPEWELANFIFNSILNKNEMAVMCSDDFKNPAYFEKKYFNELLKLEGDKGARELLNKYIMNLYKYYISDKYLIDIDTKDDVKVIKCGS